MKGSKKERSPWNQLCNITNQTKTETQHKMLLKSAFINWNYVLKNRKNAEPQLRGSIEANKMIWTDHFKRCKFQNFNDTLQPK